VREKKRKEKKKRFWTMNEPFLRALRRAERASQTRLTGKMMLRQTSMKCCFFLFFLFFFFFFVLFVLCTSGTTATILLSSLSTVSISFHLQTKPNQNQNLHHSSFLSVL